MVKVGIVVYVDTRQKHYIARAISVGLPDKNVHVFENEEEYKRETFAEDEIAVVGLSSKETTIVRALALLAPMTPEQKEEQRRSFAYGNLKLDVESTTRQQIDEAAERMKK